MWSASMGLLEELVVEAMKARHGEVAIALENEPSEGARLGLYRRVMGEVRAWGSPSVKAVLRTYMEAFEEADKSVRRGERPNMIAVASAMLAVLAIEEQAARQKTRREKAAEGAVALGVAAKQLLGTLPWRCWVEGCRRTVTWTDPDKALDYACDEHNPGWYEEAPHASAVRDLEKALGT